MCGSRLLGPSTRTSSTWPTRPRCFANDDRSAGALKLLEVALGSVAAVHGGQGPVAARLQREMQVLAHGWCLGHGLDRLGPQVLGMRAGVADPVDALDGSDGSEQVGEERP